MVTSEFALLFLDIINTGVVFACYCADLTHDKKGYKVRRVWPVQWSGPPVVYV